MKRLSIFLLSITAIWGITKLLQKAKDNHQPFTQRELEIPNRNAVGYQANEIASFLRASQRRI
jgi:DNA-binding NarL/FixJ family response regulator